MLRQYHAPRRLGGDNPLGVGTVALGAVFYLQDDGHDHAARRDPATGRWLSLAVANRTDLALVRSLHDGRRATVAIRTLQLHEDEGLGWPGNPRPRPPAIPARPA